MTSTYIIGFIIVIIALVVVIWLLNLFYHRTPKGRAFVRTGFGGERVVINGGAIVFPVIHEVTPVSLSLARVGIKAEKEDALNTNDRMRVDTEAEFFVRVVAEPQAVSTAASVLGSVTTSSKELAAFFEGEFLGALRSVASERTLIDLHENRADFAKAVKERASHVLLKSGLELDTVAIRKLDQTALEHFDPANRFDAEGLTGLIEAVEERRKLRNAIEQKSLVAIRAANLEAEKETLALERESQMARLEQEREIEQSRALQNAEITREKVAKEALANAARIEADLATNQHEISAREAVERARITADRALDESRVMRDQELKQFEISREQVVELAKIEMQITVLQKVVEEADLRIKTGEKLASAARSDESITTARETEAAERGAALSAINAEKDAKAETLRTTVAAEAARLRNEAENVLTEDARLGRLRAQLLDKLEDVVRETVKPMERIQGINVVHMSGLGGKESGGSPTDDLIDSVMRYRVQAPLVDKLLKDVGIDGTKIGSADRLFGDAKDLKSLQSTPEEKTEKTDD